MKIAYFLNIPLYLTLFRLTVVPFVIPFLIINFYNNHPILLAFIYFLISLTDFFDGFLARRFGQVTQLGALLDPLADKLVLIATLITLVAVGRLYFFCAVLLICREFFITGLRLIAAEYAFSVPVSWAGKIKTIVQDGFIIFLILASTHMRWIKYAEYCILALVLFLSLGSAFQYYLNFMDKYKKKK